MKIGFGTPTRFSCVEDAVGLYGPKEFESKTRSTVPMLDLLIHSKPDFDSILTQIGFPSDYEMHLEYKAGPFGGKGNASHTDVMLLSSDNSGNKSLAIEAKWTEPMYDTVKKWLKKGGENGANRRAVLKGWMDKLEIPDTPEIENVIYQMLHRAASARSAGHEPHLAYLIFSSPETKSKDAATQIYDGLRKLFELIPKDKRFPFHVFEINLTTEEAFNDLPKAKNTATHDLVIEALQGNRKLFSFEILRKRKVE